MAESKTARASRVVIGEVKKDPFDTPEKMITELRKQRENKLFVNRMDFVDALLAEYNKVQLLLAQEIANVVVRDIAIEQQNATIAHLGSSCAALLQRAETAEAQAKTDLFVLKEVSTARDDLSTQVAEARNNHD